VAQRVGYSSASAFSVAFIARTGVVFGNRPGHLLPDLPLSSNCAKMNRNCIASGASMKTATIPSLRVEPALRNAAEEVLRDGESLSGFVECAVRAQIQQRQEQAAFIARGLASRDRAKATGKYLSSAAVLKKLEARLAKAKKAAV
jgi:AraC-like DNA-binding protein